MTLDEAIKHCEEIACDNTNCALEHKQLAEWLNELRSLKSTKEEPASEDLEEEVHKHLLNIGATIEMYSGNVMGLDLCEDDYVDFARHFAEWQRKKDQEIDKLTESPDLDEASWKYSDRDGITYGQRYAMQIDFKAGAKWRKQQMMKELWHKGTDNPGNKHPYPVINPDTQEMAFAYYDQRFGLWEFDRDYHPGRNMLWLDIEKILPNLQEGGAQ